MTIHKYEMMIDSALVLFFLVLTTTSGADDVIVPVTMEYEEVSSCKHGLVHGKDSVLVSGRFDTSKLDKDIRDDLGFELVVVEKESEREGLTVPWRLSSEVIPIGPVLFEKDDCPPYSIVDVGTCVCSNKTDDEYHMVCNVTVVCQFSSKLTIGRIHINGKTFTDTGTIPINLNKVVGYCGGTSDQLRSCYQGKERRVITLNVTQSSTRNCPTNLIAGVDSVNVTGIILTYGLTYGRDTKLAIRRENEKDEPDESEILLQDFSVHGCRNVSHLKNNTCVCLGHHETDETLELNVTCNVAALTNLSKRLIHISLWNNHTLYSSEGVRMPRISNRCEYMPDHIPINITIDTEEIDTEDQNCIKNFTANVWHQFVFRAMQLLPPLFLSIERRGQVLVNATSECLHVIDIIAQGETTYTFSYGSDHKRFGSYKCVIIGIDTSTSTSFWSSNTYDVRNYKPTPFPNNDRVGMTTTDKNITQDHKALYLMVVLPLVMMVFVSVILFLIYGMRFCFTKAPVRVSKHLSYRSSGAGSNTISAPPADDETGV